MSQFPTQIDTDIDLPPVVDNVTEEAAPAINALRDAMFNVETEIGTGASGSAGSIANRINTAHLPDGSIKPSVLTSAGLVSLPITDAQVSSSAAIIESKLNLNYPTLTLKGLIDNIAIETENFNNFLGTLGYKLGPHLSGADYNHNTDAINVNNPVGPTDLNTKLINKHNVLRNITNLFTLLKDLNKDFVIHQLSDSSANPGTYTTTDNYAHVGRGINIDTSNFKTIPQTANDVQLFAEEVDRSNINLLGSRTQNLFSDGVARSARAGALDSDLYGQLVVPSTRVFTYLNHLSNHPNDSIDTGDDVIEFKPISNDGYIFDSYFSQVKTGDILTVNYVSVEVDFVIESVKYYYSGGVESYIIRVNNKNLFEMTDGYATAFITKPLYTQNKYSVLATASANNLVVSSSYLPSIIVGNPRSAATLGIGFDASQLDSTHYNLYLTLYPNNDVTKSIFYPPVDLTGNSSATPGKYTLESTILAFNNYMRQPGVNGRFIAFSYNGNFGIMLADSYGNSSFSINSGVVKSGFGYYDQALSASTFSNSIFSIDGYGNINNDPLGLGPNGSNKASPRYSNTWSAIEQAQLPTKIIIPYKRNYFYVDGVEQERLLNDSSQLRDIYGDGYWPAVILSKNIFPSRIETVYNIPYTLYSSNLEPGKTVTIQPQVLSSTNLDYGRFIISSVSYYDGYTLLGVYDSVHATGVSPYANANVGTSVSVYFSDDSVFINKQNVIDTLLSPTPPYKRYFESYINKEGHTFTHERARFNIPGSPPEITKINILNISKKLKGYLNGRYHQILLTITSYNSTSGDFSGFLSSNGIDYLGPVFNSKKGQVVRAFDQSNIDYIDFLFDLDTSLALSAPQTLSIQLFETLALSQQQMLLSSFQLDDSINKISYLKDLREFGNTSEENFTNSAINFINTGNKYLHSNNVVSGLTVSYIGNTVYITGGMALINGKFIQTNPSYVNVPQLRENYLSFDYTNIQWALCLNDVGEFRLIPLLDITVSAPSNPARLFIAKNPISGLTFNLEALQYSTILNTRKDLLPLSIIVTSV